MVFSCLEVMALLLEPDAHGRRSLKRKRLPPPLGTEFAMLSQKRILGLIEVDT
jgi:hypothetical protein